MTKPTLLETFKQFPLEGALVGRLLMGYGEIENALCSCVAMARDDMDMTVKAMFRPRGETQRIDIGDAMGRSPYRALGFDTQFSEAIASTRHCLKIRNQFAHCNWHSPKPGRLCFINMQEIAAKNAVIHDLRNLTFNFIDLPLLNQQEEFFQYVADLLLFLNYEGRKKAGRLSIHPFLMPKKVQPPPLSLP